MNRGNWLISLVVIMLLLATTLVVAGNFGVSKAVPEAEAIPVSATGNWEWINYGSDGGSYSPQTQVNSDNVQYLEMKWIYPFQQTGETTFPNTVQEGSSAPPIVVDGVVFTAKNNKELHAVDAKTGKQVWYTDVLTTLADFDAWFAEYPYLQGQYGHTHAVNYYRERNELIMSSMPCWLSAINADDGTLAWDIGPGILCGTAAQMGNPLDPNHNGEFKSKGYMSGIQNHPPQIIDDIIVWPSMGRSGGGGRSSIIGIDISDPANPTQAYRNWVMPPGDGSQPTWAIDQCSELNGNLWYFEYPKYLASGGTHLAVNCKDVPDDAVNNDWINMKPGTPHFGEIHTASSFSVIWGNMPYSEKTGCVYMGTGDVGPYPNGTLRFGPNLYGSALIAVNAKTGDLCWGFAALPHDLWDMDCSWGGMLHEINGREAYTKSCKNGIVYTLDSATGEPIWIFDPPSIERDMIGWNYGLDSQTDNGPDPEGPDACCDMTFEHMNKDWMTQNCKSACTDKDAAGIAHGPNAWAHIESDMAMNDKYVFMGVQNSPREFQINNVRDFGNQGSTIQQIEPKNSTIWAVDRLTGEGVWSTYLEGVSYRGGVMVSGNVVYAYASDGNMYMMDATTGEILDVKLFGVPISVLPTIGADSDGNYKVLIYIGGGGGFLFASNSLPGALAAYGLPEELPEIEVVVQQQEIVREVENQVIVEVERVVENEVIKEVEVERVVEIPNEVVKEVEVEVEVVTTEEVISPISYVAIGLGVVLVVVSGVLYTRSKGQ